MFFSINFITIVGAIQDLEIRISTIIYFYNSEEGQLVGQTFAKAYPKYLIFIICSTFETKIIPSPCSPFFPDLADSIIVLTASLT
jgi:hypothetical protein